MFKEYHVAPILNGEKVQTRRVHKRPRARVGSLHQCRTRMLDKDSCFAIVRIKRVWRERLGDISTEDARAEGGYAPREFIEGFIQMHQGRVTPDTEVYCYEFELVEDCTI